MSVSERERIVAIQGLIAHRESLRADLAAQNRLHDMQIDYVKVGRLEREISENAEITLKLVATLVAQRLREIDAPSAST